MTTAPPKESEPRRRVGFSPSPPPQEPNTPIVPRSKAGKTFTFGGNNYEQYAKDYGLDWVRIIRQTNGLHGQPLFVGDEVELPGNIAMLMVADRAAIFILKGSALAEVELVNKAKKLGLKVDVPPVKAADRPEYEFAKRKRDSWPRPARWDQ